MTSESRTGLSHPGVTSRPGASAPLVILAILLLTFVISYTCRGSSRDQTPSVEARPAAEPTPAPAGGPAEAGPGWPSPATACAILADYGLPTGGYKPESSDSWYCIGTRATTDGDVVTVPNEVTYMVSGSPSTVSKIEVIAEHFSSNAEDEEFTLKRAAIAADRVLQLVGAASPAALDAMRSGRAGTWTVEGRRIVVEKEPYPSGKGYHVRMTISQTGGA